MLVNIYRLKRRFPQMKVYTYKALVKTIQKRNDVCHIIATGASALDSFKAGVVKPGDYIMGINFAAYLPYTFDFYFFDDQFSTNEPLLSKAKCISDLLNKQKDNLPHLVYKNAARVTPDVMHRFVPDLKFSVVMDKVFYYPNVRKLFARPSFIMPQYCSSTVILATMAYHAGFKTIVMHGLDFTGPHIYHDKDLQEQIGIAAPSPYIAKDEKHVSADGQELIWPALMKKFAEKGINVCCASPNSNFKNYAKIWQQQY
jgi:hypothetical protein